MTLPVLKKLKRKITKQKIAVNYLSGLWLNLEVIDANLQSVKLTLNGQEIQSITCDQDQVQDLHLSVQKVAKAIADSRTILLLLNDAESGVVLTTAKFDVADVYLKEFEYITDSLNTCIAHLPLVNDYSVKFLSIEKRIQIIEYIYQAKLEKNCQVLLDLLISSINEKINPSLLLNLVPNKDFIALLLTRINSRLQSHVFYPFLVNALNNLMYLDAKSLIEFSDLEIEDKTLLLEKCVLKDQSKFNFIENFPDSEVEGLKLWGELTELQQQEYWPLLANALAYKRQYERLLNYPAPLGWYSDKLDKNGQVKSILQAHETRWFGISIILQEVLNESDLVDNLNHLLEFVWANYSENYVEIDTFVFIAEKLLKELSTEADYQLLVQSIVELFKARQTINENDLYRQPLIDFCALVFNKGVHNQYWDFAKLSQVTHPYYLLEHAYLEQVNFQPLQQYNPEYFVFKKLLLNKAKSVIAFFERLDALQPPPAKDIRKQLQSLLFLRENQVLNTEKWILALSRFCQINEINELLPELAHHHEKIEDYFGALQLITEPTDKLRLESLITASGKYKKRDDSYWFESALNSRRTNQSNVCFDYVEELYSYLCLCETNRHQLNQDLIELFSSELVWSALQHGPEIQKNDKVQNWLTMLENHFMAGASAFWVVLGLNKQKTLGSNLIENIAAQCGEYGEFDWLIGEYNLTRDMLGEQTKVEKLITGIRQQYLFPYTQVMIYSCNAYEKTRHKIIRESWLPLLTEVGIDYCFVVGDAPESHYDGDMLRLKVLDTYEELPHKSVEMFSFVSANSHFRYHYKLDDDCVLNVQAMFGDPAFLNKDYFGRIVKRPLGGVDRSWHHKKSTTPEAKDALDLSPEASEYCDGSTGYIVSHWGAEQLATQAKSQDNVQLINSSYFEDKLVGDLMQSANIPANDLGYNTIIRRKAALERDLQMWDFGLLPTYQNSMKVLHTEDDFFRSKWGRCIADSEVNNIPDLIYRDTIKNLNPDWLSGQEQAPVLEKINVNTNAIKNAKHIAVIVGKNEQELLPNLLQHHRDIGIEHFLFVDNCSDDDSIDYMLTQKDVSVFITTQEYKFSRFGVNWQETLCSHYGLGRWVLIIDSDELYAYSDFENQPISVITEKAEIEKANTIISPMIDFYPKGDLDSADITQVKPFYKTCEYYDDISNMQLDNLPVYGPFSNSKQYQGGLRLRIFGKYNPAPQPNYVNQKYNLIKYQPNMHLIEGLHFMQGYILASEPCAIMHFKYHASFYDKVLREIQSGQHWNGATEYKRYAKALESDSASIMFDINISEKFINSKSFSITIND